MTNATRSSFDLWYCDTCPSRDYDTVVKEFNFHSQKAQLITVSRELYGLELHELQWKMDGLYYSVTFSAIAYEGTPDPLYPAADALYYAAGGTGGSSPPPEPDSPEPSDPCAGKTCKNNYCNTDNSEFLFDCECYNGDCRCRSDFCTSGCDAAQGGCLDKQEGLCAGVDCGADFCEEDGKTRMHDCKCDPADGFCYCYSEICDNGCDAQTGACIGQVVPADLCVGVACIEKYCGDDGQTLFSGGDCDPATGKCVYQTQTCTTGCDPATLACKPDLCAGVDCSDKCENNVSNRDGTCDPTSGNCVYAESDDCGLAGCEENSAFCKRLADLSVTDVTVLQSVEGATLIAKKPTAVAVAFSWANPIRDANVSVTLFIDGKPFSTIRKIVKAEEILNLSEKYYGRDLALFHLPANYVQSGAHKFLVEAVLADEDLVDDNLANNSRTAHGEFISTSGISLMFAAHSSVPEAQIWRFYQKAKPFLSNVFPVSSVTIKPPFYLLSSTGSGSDQIAELMEIHKIHNLTDGQFAGYSVGLFKDGSFGDGVSGFSYWWVSRSVMVGDGSTNHYAHEALPHEIAGQWLDDEYTSSNPGKLLPANVRVYDGHSKRLENLKYSTGGKINLMGLAGEAGNLWVNADTWNALIPRFGGRKTGFLSAGPIMASPPRQEAGSGPGYLFSGKISVDDEVVVKTLLPFANMPYESEVEGEYSVQVISNGGAVAGEYPLPIDVMTDASADGSPFVVTVPADITNTRELRIVHNDQVIWKSSASASAPTVSIAVPAGSGPLSGIVDISWDAQDPDGDTLSYTLQYSNDSGVTWVPIAVRLEQAQYALDLDRLPGGPMCKLRVIASDGWHAAQADTPSAFAVADKPSVLVIDTPLDGAQFDYRDPIELSTYAYDTETGWIEPGNIVWHSSIDGELGKGDFLTFDDLSSGEHVITAALNSLPGQNLEQSITITIADPPKPIGMSDAAASSIQSGIALLFVIGAVFLIVVMKRKGKKVIMILAIVLLIGALVFLGFSLLYLIDSLSFVQPTGRRVATPEIEQILQPSDFTLEEEQDGSLSPDGSDFITFGDISMTVTIGGSVSPATIPSSLETDPFSGLPEHEELLINAYPVQNDMQEPVIRIFPAEIYRGSSEDADEVITALEQLLSERPSDPGKDLPFLPIWNAGSLGTTKFAYLDFQNGSGIRYITQYGQAAWPFNNRGMFYTYQGLTSDGEYYISAILPISHASLDEYDNFQPADDFYTNAQALLADQLDQLNANSEDSFVPSIEELDAMLQSLLIAAQSVG